ncbi:MAG: anthranilate phosphoribosyltransferase, partial [Actinomycetes bacterium]
ATELDPADLGLPRASVAELRGGAAGDNARVMRELVDGRPGPVHDIVTLNAAAALLADDGPGPPSEDAGDLVARLRSPLARAEEAIASGAAAGKLEHWVAATQAHR